jgi:hypothetical protein
MKENGRTAYRISEAARELGISAEWLRVRSEVTSLPLFVTAMVTATTQKNTLSACATGPLHAGSRNPSESLPESVVTNPAQFRNGRGVTEEGGNRP